ncbi:MAG: integrin, partial [Planctomycetota bacterium]
GSIGVDGNQLSNSANDSGAAYVFRRTGTTWEQVAYLKSDETQAGMQFGAAVDIDGDRIVVGAPQRDVTVPGDGRVYVFLRNGTTWSQEAKLNGIFSGDGDNFGASVAIDGTAIIVGAPLEDSFSPIGSASGGIDAGDDSVSDSGAAFAFRFENGAWSLRYFLKAEDPLTGTGNEVGAQFGYSVAIEGDIVAVGSPFEDSATIGIGGTDTATGASGSGAAYTFQWLTANSLGRTLYCKASNTGAADWFGWSVAVGLDSVLVGAVHEASNATGIGGDQADNSATDAGAVYVIR